jgi:hypothetical protein
VVPIGIASSYGVGGRDVERAFERGVNFFYWGMKRVGESVRDKALMRGRGMGLADRLVNLVSGFGPRSTWEL